MTPEQARLLIRDVADFPKPGIVFKDITPLLQDAAAWRVVVEAMAESVDQMGADYVIGVESRGFLFAAPIALQLGLGVALISTAGIWSLPGQVAFAELYAAGASVAVIVVAVSMANVRFLPLVLSLMPLVRSRPGLRL